ncbi:MAG: hypothetical protein ACYC8S_01710 [Minisyncoccota bacterium]
MKQTLSQFLKLHLDEPPARLYPEAIFLLRENSHLQRQRRLWALWGLIIASSAGMVGATLYTVQEVARSGFLHYVALLGSDTSTVIAHAKDFALLLAESAPVVGLALFFGAVFLLLEAFWFLKQLPREVALYSI